MYGKTRATRKFVMGVYDKVIELGYCELAMLLDKAGYEPRFYTCGAYGWNADVYEIPHNGEIVAICTGHRPFGNVKVDHRCVEEYERRCWTWRGSWERQRSDARRAIDRLITETFFFGESK